VRPDLLPQTLLQVFPSVHALQTCLTPRCFRQALGDEFAPAHACMHVCMYAFIVCLCVCVCVCVCVYVMLQRGVAAPRDATPGASGAKFSALKTACAPSATTTASMKRLVCRPLGPFDLTVMRCACACACACACVCACVCACADGHGHVRTYIVHISMCVCLYMPVVGPSAEAYTRVRTHTHTQPTPMLHPHTSCT